jgi:hypothetical protein
VSDDPVRWKDAADAPPRVRELLRARAEPASMPPEARVALLAQLSQQVAAPPAPKANALKTVLGSQLGAGVAVTTTVAVVAALAWRMASPSPPVTVLAPPTASASASVMPEHQLAPSPSISTETPTVVPPPASSRPARPAPPTTTDTLARESALIGRARGSLVSNPASSLEAIDEHARKYPQGELAPEREYLRVSALHRLGRDDEAKARARAYLGRFSSSPYVPAVKKLLTELEPR